MKLESRSTSRLWIGVLVLTLVVVLVAWRAFTWLDDAGRDKIYEELVKLSYQFLVIVGLGALLKKVIDDTRDRRAADEERMRQSRNEDMRQMERMRNEEAREIE